MHIAGVGDFLLASVTSSPDPFLLSSNREEENLTHMETESFKTGDYLRIEVHDVPIEMVENFNPYHLILVGGISLEEEDVGYMQVHDGPYCTSAYQNCCCPEQ